MATEGASSKYSPTSPVPGDGVNRTRYWPALRAVNAYVPSLAVKTEVEQQAPIGSAVTNTPAGPPIELVTLPDSPPCVASGAALVIVAGTTPARTVTTSTAARILQLDAPP